MAAPDSTKLQVNFKLADGTLINIYATTQAELEANLQSISDLAQLILATGGDLGKGANVAYATKALGGTVVDEPVWAAEVCTRCSCWFSTNMCTWTNEARSRWSIQEDRKAL